MIAALALGLIALVTLPREEEPQISVPMVDIMVRADGLKAADAVKLITEPLETIVKSINGVEHVYSRSYDDQVVVTVRFLVGTPPTQPSCACTTRCAPISIASPPACPNR